MSAIEAGRPGDAEYETSRKVQVLQARTGVSLDEAARVVARPDEGAERIWGKTVDFVDVAFFERGRRAARAVARIVTKDGAPLGTGFLISPRLMMTNNHVIGSEAEAAALVAEFEYERDVGGRMLAPTTYEFEPTTCFVTNSQDDLDYTVVALGRRISGATELAALGYLPVSAARNKHQLGDFVNIIQHPDGRPKEAVIRENQLVARSGTTLDYVADTEPGSSGSPVLNVQFALVALHHWGTPHRELTDENGKTIPKTVNEGIRASSISSDLTTLRTSLQSGPRSLIDEALQLGLSSDAPAASAQTAGEASARVQSTPMGSPMSKRVSRPGRFHCPSRSGLAMRHQRKWFQWPRPRRGPARRRRASNSIRIILTGMATIPNSFLVPKFHFPSCRAISPSLPPRT
ncbi:serine protease [Bradyrhizobium sp. CSS354]|uniref:trypsin-like serine peptidase n=1 Tax=Bradyrhizobium sp. CSS354 TaxID=2699172 RepID=UPI0023AFC4BB|nr:serine protease [Bradyrhizobium sp. CSS354]MDE5464922.1 hypothetical protein [Bradyrhizobium sp. CSS354]